MWYLTIFLLSVGSHLFGIGNTLIRVTSDLDKAQSFVENFQKPLLVVFLGNACTSNSELILKQIKNEKFENCIQNDLGIFLADLNFQLFSIEEIKHYEELLERFQVKSFPTLVLCDHNLQEISKLESSGLSPEELALEIKKHHFSYELIKLKLASANLIDLKKLYYQAVELGGWYLKNLILNKAFDCGLVDLEFKVEKYLSLINDKADNKVLQSYKEKYLFLEQTANSKLLERVIWLDYQLAIPMIEQEKLLFEKVLLENELVKIPG